MLIPISFFEKSRLALQHPGKSVQLQRFQSWRLQQFESHRKALKQDATSMPFVYVMASRQADHTVLRFLSVPALLERLYHDNLEAFWSWSRSLEVNEIVASFTLQKWSTGPLAYYGTYAATCLDDLLKTAQRHDSQDDVAHHVARALDEMPLLLLVDVLVFWQMAWQRQDPSMNQWSIDWEPAAPSGLLLDYVQQRLNRQSSLQ